MLRFLKIISGLCLACSPVTGSAWKRLLIYSFAYYFSFIIILLFSFIICFIIFLLYVFAVVLLDADKLRVFLSSRETDHLVSVKCSSLPCVVCLALEPSWFMLGELHRLPCFVFTSRNFF